MLCSLQIYDACLRHASPVQSRNRFQLHQSHTESELGCAVAWFQLGSIPEGSEALDLTANHPTMSCTTLTRHTILRERQAARRFRLDADGPRSVSFSEAAEYELSISKVLFIFHQGWLDCL